MLTLERRNQIMDILKTQKTVTVRDLSRILYVSEATVRRDLGEMETLGLLRRTHGGAVLYENGQSEPSVLVRMEENAQAKRRMAELTLPYLERVSSVFMDSSSSVHYLATIWQPDALTVFTTGIGTALHFAGMPQVRTVLPGGEVQYHTDSLEGAVTLEQLGNFYAEVMICSCGGIGADGRVTESTGAQCAIKQAMMAHSEKKILLADHTKLFRHRPFLTASLSSFDMLVTDCRPDADFEALCHDSGVRLLYDPQER